MLAKRENLNAQFPNTTPIVRYLLNSGQFSTKFFPQPKNPTFVPMSKLVFVAALFFVVALNLSSGNHAFW
jgi:hypothetical protein